MPSSKLREAVSARTTEFSRPATRIRRASSESVPSFSAADRRLISAGVSSRDTAARNSARVAFELRHGQAATNTFKFSAANAQLGKPTFREADGVQMVTIPLRFIPSSAGNDEWQIEV